MLSIAEPVKKSPAKPQTKAKLKPTRVRAKSPKPQTRSAEAQLALSFMLAP